MTAVTDQALVPCVCFILLRDGCVLLEQRRADKAVDPGLVMIPGGHMEAGETTEQTLLREMREELGIVPRHARYVCSLQHRTAEAQLLHYYLITDWQGDIQAHEAERVYWHPLEQLDQLDIHPDGIAIREALHLYA